MQRQPREQRVKNESVEPAVLASSHLQREIEKNAWLVSAAVQLPSGARTFTGPDHGTCCREIVSLGLDPTDRSEGFMTENAVFLTRHEAKRLAMKTGQLSRETVRPLSSGDISFVRPSTHARRATP